MIELFRLAGPSIVLIDEWVAYARQLPARENEPALVGGHFDTQFTFAQALTEAAAAVPNVVVLVSIPASDIEVGGDKGQDALARLRNVVRRKSAQWKPAEDDESFEIVRRRLFEPMSPDKARVRDGVIKAFCDYYREKPGRLPERGPRGRVPPPDGAVVPDPPRAVRPAVQGLVDPRSLPAHPRRAAADGHGDLGAVAARRPEPADHAGHDPDGRCTASTPSSRSTSSDGWDPVIRSDVDGPNALPLRLDQENRNLGRYSSTRRVARAVYLASAPREEARRGIDIKLITLGVAQPGESPGTFADALRRLSGDATYLYVDGAQYWYSLRANITRLAADRAASNVTDDNADDEIKRRLQATRAIGTVRGRARVPRRARAMSPTMTMASTS